MVIPLGEGDEQILTRFRKVGETFEKEEFGLYNDAE
jgi:protein-L-isoaspartate(D-aspartate) O-methyltransferase